MNNRNGFQLVIAVFLIAMASIYRIIPHPWNFAPVTAIALLGGAHIHRKSLAFAIPILALFLGDLVLNNTVYRSFYPDVTGTVFFAPYMLVNFVCFSLFVLLGIKFLRKFSFTRLFAVSISSSLLFFFISNLAVWAGSIVYPKNIIGLIECFTAGLPFLQTTLIGDLVFGFLLFGSFELVLRLKKQYSTDPA